MGQAVSLQYHDFVAGNEFVKESTSARHEEKKGKGSGLDKGSAAKDHLQRVREVQCR
jgi:hypothetical protein